MADQQGVAIIDMEDPHLSLTGINNILGRGVVIHAGMDDLGKVRTTLVVMMVMMVIVVMMKVMVDVLVVMLMLVIVMIVTVVMLVNLRLYLACIVNIKTEILQVIKCLRNDTD